MSIPRRIGVENGVELEQETLRFGQTNFQQMNYTYAYFLFFFLSFLFFFGIVIITMPSSSKIFLVRPCYSSRVFLWDRFRKRDYNSNKNLVCDGRKIASDRSWFWRGYNLMLIFFFFLKKVQILRLSLLFACFFFFFTSWVDDERSRMIFFLSIKVTVLVYLKCSYY